MHAVATSLGLSRMSPFQAKQTFRHEGLRFLSFGGRGAGEAHSLSEVQALRDDRRHRDEQRQVLPMRMGRADSARVLPFLPSLPWSVACSVSFSVSVRVRCRSLCPVRVQLLCPISVDSVCG